MKLWNHYYTPTTIDDAVSLLAQYHGEARVIAGGTDLLIDAKAKPEAHPFAALVDITRIPELCQITQDGDSVTIGAGVTHTQIVASPIVQKAGICLVESCGVIGGPQVRNVATLGGNVAHALPAGDGTTSLVALDAQVDIVHNGERKWVSIREMFKGTAQSLIDSTRDILLRFRFNAVGAREGTAFERVMRPQGVALPVLSSAVWVQLNAEGTQYQAVRVCIAPAAPIPQRVAEVESAIIGMPVGAETVQAMVALAGDHLKLRTSKYRATADYRHEMADVLLRRTLSRATERAMLAG
jgi:CO/xanthine dehydrogenase FAD-binding subunit